MQGSGKINRFTDLRVWQEAHRLVLHVYNLSRNLPSEEKFGLVMQMRRAAVSIPANIAEGFKRRGIKDKSRFYNIAQASLEELRYYLLLCRDLGHRLDYQQLENSATSVSKMLNALDKAVTR